MKKWSEMREEVNAMFPSPLRFRGAKMKLVYVSTPLKPEKFFLDQIQEKILAQNVFAFIPPQTAATKEPTKAAIVNKKAIEACDEVWVFGPVGRDCSWEMGYAQALGKPVKFHVCKENAHMIPSDWMLFMKETEIVDDDGILTKGEK